MPSTTTHPDIHPPQDPECACQWGASGHCRRGRHDRCDQRWVSPPETTLAYRNQVFVHQINPVRPLWVWLADRRCAWVCKCPCHQKPRATAAPMAPHQAAWVRAHVWTQHMRRTHEHVPGANAACACQYGTTGHCRDGRHDSCTRGEELPAPEGHITRPTGQTVSFAEAYTHPSPAATGHHRTSAAQVWLADRVCQWVCDCDCHTEAEQPPPLAPPTEPDPGPGAEYEQSALF